MAATGAAVENPPISKSFGAPRGVPRRRLPPDTLAADLAGIDRG